MAVQGYSRFPTIHGDRIVFTSEDDLWQVSSSGGRAERLTAGVAEATRARFSPDGSLLAFTGASEGPDEIYVMPASGGDARRLTFEGDRAAVAAWRPDGSQILYSSAAGQATQGRRVLHAVSPTGGEPQTLPYGIASALAFGPSGELVLGRNTGELAYWKRYRGGTAGYLWIDPSGSGQFQRLLPDLRSNITGPCWAGDRVFFISDHEGIGNVYSCLPSGEDLRRHTRQDAYYARHLATDGNRLVYVAAGDLYLLDPDTNTATPIPVELASARAQRARRFVPAAQFLDSWSPNPQGHAVAATSRGKAFSFGNWEGPVVQHGAPDGVRYRLLTWLADGKRLVAVADDGGEPGLAIFNGDTAQPDRILDTLDVGIVAELRASPVGDRVLLLNHRCEVVLVDLASETLRVLDRSPYARNELTSHARGCAWSPDGAWVAYAFAINPRQTAIKLCRIDTGEIHQVTQPVLHDTRPAFDPNGKYLYFLSARDFDPVQDNLQFGWSFPKGTRPYLVTLRRDLRSPFRPEPAPPKSDAAEQAEAAKSEEKASPPKAVEIDLDGIATRIVAFPVEEGRYGRIQGTHEGVLFTSYLVTGSLNEPEGGLFASKKGALESYHFESHKQERIADGIGDFEVTANGKSVLYRAGDRLRMLKAGEKPQAEGEAANKPGRESGWLDLNRVKVAVRPETEWRQMLGEAWRMQREFFWVPDMAGVQWQRAYDKYALLLERIGSRGELSDLMWEMQGELGSSHAYEYGGEYRPHPDYAQGLLGVDWRFEPASGRYAIAHIVTGDAWRPEATSPLLAPGINIHEGDAILAINGQRVTPEIGPQQLLVNQAGNEVELLVRPADGSVPRAVVVRALADEHPARYRDWVEGNRRKVHEATSGKVGYLHVPNMVWSGFAEFHRYFLAEYDHEGLIVDVRWNGGGIVSPLVLEKLMRPRLGYGFQRWGQPEPYFYESPRGNLVALTDEHAGSDGDIFSHVFKMLKLGPLIGKRTWGGVIGYNDAAQIPFTDGSLTTQPEFSYWFNDVGWGVENYGTDPTIDVDYPPQAYAAGEDPQLDRAIAETLRLVAENPKPTPMPGPRPERGFPPRG
jgi:tricorn protease